MLWNRPAIVTISLIVATFLLDWHVPLGYVTWAPYLLAIICSAQWRGGRSILITTTITCALTAMTFLLSSKGSLTQGGVNRLFGMGIQALVALACWTQVRLNDRVARQRTHYQLLFDNTPIAIWEEDFSRLIDWFDELRATGVTDLRTTLQEKPELITEAMKRIDIVDVNQGAVQQNNAKDKVELCSSLSRLFTEETNKSFIEELVAIWEGKHFFELESTSLRLDGSPLDVILRLVIPEIDGRRDYSHVIVTGTDITQRREVERQLAVARDQAEEANRIKTTFLSRVSHEMRTPLNGIVGMTNLLLSSELTVAQQAQLELIQASTQSLTELVTDLLDLSRVESGRLVLAQDIFDLHHSCAAFIGPLMVRAQQKGLTLRWSIDESIPQRLLGDRARVCQILINLISNAIKYTEEGEIHASAQLVQRIAHRVYLAFKVTDTGVGLTQQLQEQIWSAFEDDNLALSSVHHSGGIGLPIVNWLARRMEGSVNIETELGKGTTFIVRIWLGVPEEHQEPQKAPKVVQRWAEPLSILIVEDNRTNQRVAEGILQRMGHQTQIADNGQIALEILDQMRFDVILMDLSMPVMDGYEALKRIRARDRSTGDHSLIITVTAEDVEGRREECLNLGFDEFLSKPLSRQRLHEMLAVRFPEKILETIED